MDIKNLRNLRFKKITNKLYNFDVVCGAMIENAIGEAIMCAKNLNATVQFEFNSVTVLVRSDSDPELIRRDWSRAIKKYIDSNVGPYPNSVLTNEEKKSDARIEAENEDKRQKRQAEDEAQARAKREAVETKLVEAPEMEFANENGWQEFKDKNKDGYGAGVVDYAKRWAQLMQYEMVNGGKLQDVAKATSDEADTDGITGFMYGCAVSALARYWKYGEQLRCWHNLYTQIGSEGEMANQSGGVLNPARLSIE